VLASSVLGCIGDWQFCHAAVAPALVLGSPAHHYLPLLPLHKCSNSNPKSYTRCTCLCLGATVPVLLAAPAQLPGAGSHAEPVHGVCLCLCLCPWPTDSACARPFAFPCSAPRRGPTC